MLYNLAPTNFDHSSGWKHIGDSASEGNLFGQLTDGSSKPSKITKMKHWIHSKV